MQKTLFDLDPPRVEQRAWFQELIASMGIAAGAAWPDRFGSAIRNWIVEHRTHSVRTLSLFSGGGGLDIAFHDAGFDIVEMIEVEPKYVETLKANAQKGKLLESSRVICKDIRDYQPKHDLKIDFIIGGPPCQTFSAAGRRAAGVPGITDPRGTLFAEYVRLLKELNPVGFLFENVYGITGAQDGLAWKEIQSAFKREGYIIHFRVLDAADYGVPQHRERLFIVGLREGSYSFPYPTHGPDSIGQYPYYTASEAVSGVDTTDATQGLGGRYGHLLTDIPPGLNYSFYTKELGHPSPVFSWRSKFSDFLYKADPDSPVRTIKAQGGQYTGPFSWENRPFTVAELKRLQTIPDNYNIIGGRQIAIEQIGNSVPPQIGRILALSILDQVINVELPFQMYYMPEEKQLGFRQRKRFLTDVYASKAKSAIERIYKGDRSATTRNEDRIEKESIRYISSDFSWGETAKAESIEIKLRYDLNPESWSISARSINFESNKDIYKIVIAPSSKNDWCLGKREVSLCAREFDFCVFTSLWKAFEEEISRAYGIADLVQLSGYYQYKSRVIARLEFVTESEVTDLWRMLQYVVQGVGVGEQMAEQRLALIWGVNPQDLLNHLKTLRAIGYEVRGHSTNPQIAQGEYLIPYVFPTLTPRSVQLRKRLDDGESEAEKNRRAISKSVL